MNMEIIKQLAILIVGFALLVKGADLFVDGASGIAKKFGISELIIGLTIVAMGTSAPEAAVSIAAATKGSAGISIGNVIGSNIMNIFIILGVVAAITPLKIERSTVRYEMPFTIIVTVLFVLMGRDGLITRADGAILWAGLLLYIAYLLRQAKQKPAEVPAQAETAVQKQKGPVRLKRLRKPRQMFRTPLPKQASNLPQIQKMGKQFPQNPLPSGSLSPLPSWALP